LNQFQTTFNGALAGIQGSGWGWLVKKDGELAIVTTPVSYIPLLQCWARRIKIPWLRGRCCSELMPGNMHITFRYR